LKEKKDEGKKIAESNFLKGSDDQIKGRDKGKNA
jgi:hypothetical protein